jgi:hypothetical protein
MATTTAARPASVAAVGATDWTHNLRAALLTAVLGGVVLFLVLAVALAASSNVVAPTDGPRPSPSAQAPPTPPGTSR